LQVIKIIFEVAQVSEVHPSACCVQTTACSPVVLPHFMVAGSAEMISDVTSRSAKV